MSTQEPSKCCVCGAATTKRCQACAKSGIDLFFCSPEHQKLVWKYHKQVCGPNAHPFRFPALSPDEVAGIVALENDPVTELDRQDVAAAVSHLPHASPAILAHSEASSSQPTLGRMFETGWNLPAGSFQQYVQSLAAPAQVPMHNYFALSAFREQLRAHRARQSSNLPQGWPCAQLWLLFSRFDNVVHEKMIQSASAAFIQTFGSEWLKLSQYRHQAVVLLSLILARENCGPGAVPLRFIRTAFEQLFLRLAELEFVKNVGEAMQWFRSVKGIMHSAGLQDVRFYREPSGKLYCVCT